MPLVAHNDLPTFERLKQYGIEMLSLEQARHQDIRELHIGLLNMMPDAALAATERQFINLVGNCNKIAQFYVYPFSIPELDRGPEAEAYIQKYYFDFNHLKENGLDALIITGANITNPRLVDEPFWDALIDVVRWGEDNVASMLCSCLATHAMVKHYHGIERRGLPAKQWGVYSHRVINPDHPLVRDINTRFDTPHSRWNDVGRVEMESAGMHVLAESEEADVLLAVSPDGFRAVYFQGHPEYDANSLLKEYKREVFRFLRGEIGESPPFPEHYFNTGSRQVAKKYLVDAMARMEAGEEAPEFPEEALTGAVDNTWRDTGKAIVNNWLGLVYRLTNMDRHRQFMEGVDPSDPLGLRRSRPAGGPNRERQDSLE